MNNTRESIHIENFRNICPNFPAGRIEKTESPDFIIHASGGLIGIEYTQIFQPGPPHSGSLQAQDNLAQRIMKRAKEMWLQTDGCVQAPGTFKLLPVKTFKKPSTKRNAN